MNNSLLLIIEDSYLQTFLHSLGKSALPICNYSQILYQFLTFTQNLKRSLKVAFAHLEEHLYVPTFSVDTDDFILIQIYVRGNKAEIFLAFVTIANINYFGSL